MAEQYLNKEGVQTLWTAVKGKISTAQTTVENEFVNGTKKAKYAQQADNIGGVALSGLVQSIKVGSKTFSPKNSVVTLDEYALSTHTHTFASLTSKPTTISGYGITDAYTKKESDGKYATKATTLKGYGITDAYTKTESDGKYATKATTLAGYGITDAYTKTESDGKYATKTESDGKYATKATTLAGYGITDAYTKTESDGKYATKTDSDKKYQPKGSYATLDSSGHVPSSQLPSYVDDVIEGYYSNGKFYSDSAKTKEITGEGGKIYTDLTTNKTYRWGGTAWVEISKSLAIGETAGTAYDGAKGAKNASDISLLKTDVSTLKTDNTQNKKDIANLKANVYTKTESDEKYVPASNEDEATNSLSFISNDNGEFHVKNYDTDPNLTSSSTGFNELFVAKYGVGMVYGDYGVIIQDEHGPQMKINDELHRFLIDTDLPTAISTSDLNTILV